MTLLSGVRIRFDAEPPHPVHKAARTHRGIPVLTAAQPALSGDERRLAQLFMGALARLQNSAAGTDVADALGLGDAAGVVAALDWQGWSDLLASAADLYARQAVDGAKASVATLPDGTQMLVDTAMPDATAAAHEAAGQLVTDITASTRAVIAQVIADAMSSGASVPTVAAMLKDVLGLNSQQATAVERLRALLADPKANNSAGQVDNAVAAYRDGLLRYRAQTVAITEMSHAANAGRYAGYLKATLSGAVDPSAQKAVIVAPGCCRYCQECVNSNSLTGYFSVNDVAALYPPFHPRCRCTFILVNPGDPLYDDSLN